MNKQLNKQINKQLNQEMNYDYDYLFKILLVGDSGVGKSSLLLRFTENTYCETFIATIGVDFKIKTVNIDNKVIKLQIWDTAGQERFRTITSSYYRGANAAILVYDITNIKSFDNIEKWLNELNNFSTKNIQKIIVGNKADLHDQRMISYDDAKLFCDDVYIKLIETSAKDSDNVDEMFTLLARDLLNENNIYTDNTKNYGVNNTINFKNLSNQEQTNCCKF